MTAEEDYQQKQKRDFAYIVGRLKESGVDPNELGGWGHTIYSRLKTVDLAQVQRVYSEREGMDYDSQVDIFHFQAFNVYIQINGYYSSYDGDVNYNNEYYHVMPEQVTVTKYKFFN